MCPITVVRNIFPFLSQPVYSFLNLYLETPVLSLLGLELTSVNSSSHDCPDISHLFRLNIPGSGLQIPSPYSSSLETIPLKVGHQECAQNFINSKVCFAVESLPLFKLFFGLKIIKIKFNNNMYIKFHNRIFKGLILQ